MSEAAVTDKATLRREMARRREALDAATLAARSLEACRRLLSTPEWAVARTVALYAATGGEADPSPLFSHRDGRRLALPRMQAGERRLAFHRVDDPSALVPGPYGVREPPADPATAVALEEIDLFVVPGLAFDAAGRRLGRGGGHYDATLAASRADAVRVGFGLDWQRLPTLAIDPWDEGVDLVITDEKVLRVAGRSGTKAS